MYKAKCGNNIRRKDDFDAYRYRCEACEALGHHTLQPPHSLHCFPRKVLHNGLVKRLYAFLFRRASLGNLK
jgi:hypothetical protein